ncbi:MAG: hypothetical protein FWF41_06425 [Betaproteobacteria bacterium]|nr:hypothetical protein [Betaproteobacteria bacterium]
MASIRWRRHKTIPKRTTDIERWQLPEGFTDRQVLALQSAVNCYRETIGGERIRLAAHSTWRPLTNTEAVAPP